MARRVLVALDSSRGAWRAVEFAASVLARVPGARVELLHVLPEDPSYFWDFGHIMAGTEASAARRLTEAWQSSQERRWEALCRRALQRLTKTGLPESSISRKFVRSDRGVADAVLREAESGRFDVVILGRRGHGAAGAAALGGVALSVLQRARGRAVVVAD